MATGIILGTRPEIIKMSPIIREYRRRGLDHFVIHTGQHYSYELDGSFFDDLELDEPMHNLKVGSGSQASQTGRIMAKVEKVLQGDCDLVLVQGDTNTVLAGALAAAKLNIPVGHVEAGLRSYDRTMPEEINRVVADHVSELLFAPTETAKNNLLKEGISEHSVHVTGNTVVDAVHQNLTIAKKRSTIMDALYLASRKYIVVTTHRAENVDNPEKLRGIIEGLDLVSEYFNIPLIFPIHPRTRKMMNKYKITPRKVTVIPPVGYLDFLVLEANASLILTDSGGVQEESCILGVPCVTLRENTERPETLDVGSNLLAGTVPNNILQKAIQMSQKEHSWLNPFGDGKAAYRILEIIESRSYKFNV